MSGTTIVAQKFTSLTKFIIPLKYLFSSAILSVDVLASIN